MRQARRFQKTKPFREAKRRRQTVEHRIARLRQLGVRQSRYFGRAKTLFQLLLAATVANLTLVAASVSRSTSSFPSIFAVVVWRWVDMAGNRHLRRLMAEHQEPSHLRSFKELRRAA